MDPSGTLEAGIPLCPPEGVGGTGMEILRSEGVYPFSLVGHGGLFKTPGVAEKILSDMLGIPVTTRATAGEGGAWGIARLATVIR